MMQNLFPLFKLGLKRRSRDFFVLFYNIVFPVIVILILGYLTSKSYGTKFTSYYYYTIVIIPFCALMGITTVSYAAQDEKTLHTSYRYMIAPITKVELILSKFFSCTIILSLCNAAALLIVTLLVQMNLNGKFILIALLLTCETIMVTGIGLYLGLTCKNLDVLRNFLNLPIIIFGFLGGAFFPVGSLNPVLSFIIKISPLTWVNRGIVECIYNDSLRILLILSAVFTVLGAVLIVLTIKFFKKEAFI